VTLSGWSWPTPTRRCCATGPCPTPLPRWWSTGSAIHAPDAYALVLPTVVVGDQVLGTSIVVQAVDIIRRR
jgi:hypothetical protein